MATTFDMVTCSFDSGWSPRRGASLWQRKLRPDRTLSRWHGAVIAVQHGRMAPALDIPPHSYGSLIETTPRVVTGMCGGGSPWEERESAIISCSTTLSPHPGAERVVGEGRGSSAPAWRPLSACRTTSSAGGRSGGRRWVLRCRGHVSVADQHQLEPDLGRRPRRVRRGVRSRGPIHVYGVVMDARWFDESRARQDVRASLGCVNETQDRRIRSSSVGTSTPIRTATRSGWSPAGSPHPFRACRSTTPGRRLDRVTRAPRGRAPTRGRLSRRGRTAVSTTSCRPHCHEVGPYSPAGPDCWAPVRSMASTPRNHSAPRMDSATDCHAGLEEDRVLR